MGLQHGELKKGVREYTFRRIVRQVEKAKEKLKTSVVAVKEEAVRD